MLALKRVLIIAAAFIALAIVARISEAGLVTFQPSRSYRGVSP